MHFALLNKAERADWREMLNVADPAHLALAAVLFFFSAIALPLSHVPAVSGLYLVGGVIFYYALTRSFASLIPVAIPAVLLYGFTALTAANPMALPAAYAAVLLGSVSGAFVIVNSRKLSRALPLAALPVIAYLLSFFITRNAVLSLTCLVPMALASVLAYCLLTCRPHTPSVVLLTVAIAVIAVGAWLIALVANGWPDTNPLTDLASTLHDGLLSYYESAIALYEEQGLALDISLDDLDRELTALGNLLPGLFAALCTVLAFGIWRIFLRLLTAWHTLPRVPARLAGVTVSVVTAALFVLAYVVALIAGAEESTLASSAALNVAMMLEPPLVLVGVSSLAGQGKQRSCLSLLLLLGLFALMASYPSAGLALTAFVGAFSILLAKFLPPRDKGEL